MADPSQDLGALLLAVGRLEGRVGEIVHGQNDMRQKVDGIAEKVLTAPTRDDYDKLDGKIDEAVARIDALEATNDRNDGAKGVFAAILQSRFAAWAAAAIAVAFAAIKGDVIK